jgi:MFS transporter, DHA1 family, multidrug resistance protein
MSNVIRDAPIGQLIRLITRNRVLRYAEEQPDFALPEPWKKMMDNETKYQTSDSLSTSETTTSSSSSSIRQGGDDDDNNNAETIHPSQPQSAVLSSTRSQADPEKTGNDVPELKLEKTKSIPIVPKKTKDGAILVDWYYSDDPENPHNWTNLRRAMVTVIICIYTFVVYTSSAIYTTSESGVMAEFGVNDTQAALGLALFVLGYGIGPLLFSPLSELPSIGRNPVYTWTMFLFVIVSIPAAVATNYPGLMVLRFLQGLFGSPCLANGAASLADIYSMMSVPYALIAWVSAAYCGPALGPLLSGFSVPVMGWRWSLLEVLWASVPVFLAMFLFLPETSTPTLLRQRASRLRKITGDERFLSQSEIDERNLDKRAVLVDALIKPLEITIKDPAILFVQVYSAIIYGIYYSFFEVFPLVYPVYYGMGPGQIGLVFLCILVACLIGVAVYISYLYFYLNPRIAARGFPVQESRLTPALIAAFGPTVGLFIFAWTARPDVHWIAPTVGITVYGATVFVIMQCIFVYVPLSYPQYAASLFAGNDFFRSALAFASILFAKPMFANLGVARGTTLLAGLSVIGIVGIWVLYFTGARLRSMSKFAVSAEEEE